VDLTRPAVYDSPPGSILVSPSTHRPGCFRRVRSAHRQRPESRGRTPGPHRQRGRSRRRGFPPSRTGPVLAGFPRPRGGSPSARALDAH
jgi:hypothetical protein